MDSKQVDTKKVGADGISDAADTIGNATDATGNTANAIGNATDTTGNAADTTGNAANATGNAADAIGNATDTTGNAADAIRNATDTTGNGVYSGIDSVRKENSKNNDPKRAVIRSLSISECQSPAIDTKVLSGDISSCRRCQKTNHCGQFLRSPKPVQRHTV